MDVARRGELHQIRKHASPINERLFKVDSRCLGSAAEKSDHQVVQGMRTDQHSRRLGGLQDPLFRSDGPIKTGQELLQQARANADITGEREIIQQLDVDAEGVENDEDGYKTDVLLDFHQ